MPEDDHSEVLQANQGFYDAFGSLDIDRMETAWSRGDVVTCVHPGWPSLNGWFEVMQSWERIFSGATMMTFTITEPECTVSGDVAWVTCTENLTTLVDGRVMSARVETTNIFRWRDRTWKMVHHHGSPAPDR